MLTYAAVCCRMLPYAAYVRQTSSSTSFPLQRRWLQRLSTFSKRGHIDLHAPESTYWPAFRSGNGHADKITVAHVPNHQGGLADAGADDMARCLQLLLYETLSCYFTRPSATSAGGLKLLVYAGADDMVGC